MSNGIGIGISPTLFSIKKGKYLAELLSILSRLTGEQPSTALKELMNDTIGGLKSDGVFQLGDCLYIRGVHTAELACQNWIKNAHNSTLVNSPLFIEKVGIQGAAGKFINNNYNPFIDHVNFNASNASQCYGITTVSTANGYIMGGLSVTSQARVLHNVGAKPRHYFQSTSYNDYYTLENGDYIGVDTNVNNRIFTYKNGIQGSSVNSAYTGLPNNNMYDLAANINGSLSGAYVDGIINFSWYGGYLGSSLQLSLYNRIKFFYNNVGSTF